MGQRLNIEIKNEKEILANAYYHWSGYTISSLELTKIVTDFIENNSFEPTLETAVKCLEETGATFTDKEFLAYQDKVKYSVSMTECNGRNNGLIAVSKEGMEETRSWEEGRITINISDKTIRFECARVFEMLRDYDDLFEKVKDDFFIIQGVGSSYSIPFNKLDLVIAGVKTAEKNYKGRFVLGYECYASIY